MATQKKGSSDKIVLSTTLRRETGKKVRKLRKEGIIPANIFGRDFASRSISMTVKNFIQAYKKARATGIIYVSLDQESIPTLISNIQRDPIRDSVLHVDFRKVDLKQKIETAVPVTFIGQSEAVSVKGGVLITQSDHLMVEALPTDIPSRIEVDLTKIKEIGQEIKVSDLAKSTTFEIKEEPNKVIVSVTEHKEESVVPETTVEAPEITTEKVPEAVEGEAPTAEGATVPAATPAPAAGEKKDAKPEQKPPEKKKK
ncbi:hypothetical protein A3F03_02940 [Candidatus Roizmanbacteria bacterium RIFCSPHIGHO2_12_FULL_41_11]|uniref:Large ribosomal subunit protein bL25 n=2 Tax=Candidatus Roizmaniibacteriota TaxID=1752723 RepID=A0A1F7J8C2_9BACT|nr:MAG: hypothetical protein A3F03_02940 [Candidatus Roizmanbacteria bacterium RIFCSPHIGHO2_12_FULL_41_11]OGK51862.1 MAG: hypothetical protein A2966_00590 [Candidatus Roizmanbacteria bacterium RIFCSPLOWO2_01_FULL_41_22]